MAILPLPQFEADLLADQETYAKLKPPTSIVVRFGVVRMVGEFAYDGDAKPGCGSKLVARTHRGTELCEMLTSTCPNAGCSKSVSRREMLEYIDNSGGRDYPFFTEGRILRVATVEDLNKQAALDAAKLEHIKLARRCALDLGLPMKIVDAEELLGGERITFSFTPTRDEHARVDFRPLVMELAQHYRTRIEMRQVGARDEARINADYEKCGQHCCCKQFLKVLKPVSMKNAKIQKATLDPLKISGRCGRLMCCLRYEESTYDDLRKRLPRKKTPIMTPDGPGIVIDSQILTQLVLVRLDATNEDAAYPLENLSPPGSAPLPAAGPAGDEDDDAPVGTAHPADAPRAGPAGEPSLGPRPAAPNPPAPPRGERRAGNDRPQGPRDQPSRQRDQRPTGRPPQGGERGSGQRSPGGPSDAHNRGQRDSRDQRQPQQQHPPREGRGPAGGNPSNAPNQPPQVRRRDQGQRQGLPPKQDRGQDRSQGQNRDQNQGQDRGQNQARQPGRNDQQPRAPRQPPNGPRADAWPSNMGPPPKPPADQTPPPDGPPSAPPSSPPPSSPGSPPLS